MQLRTQFVQVSKQASEYAIKFNNLLILSPQATSIPRGGSHDWVRQTPRSFEITVLDISQMISRPRGGSHDWVWQTPQSFEITLLEFISKHRIQTEF
jgi:hypothetical protein